MDLLLNDEQMLLRDAAAKLGAAKGGPRRARKLREAHTEIDSDAWDDVLKAGWLSALVAERHDGLGLGAFDLALALEETGKQVLMTPLVEAAAACWALSQSGCPLSDNKLIVPATIVPGQDYAQAPRGKSPAFDPLESKLSGAVTYVPFAAKADAFLIDAEFGAGTALCLVPRDAQGLSIETRQLFDGSTMSALSFARVPVAADTIVSRDAVVIRKMQELLVLGTSAELLGVTQSALEMTLDYIKFREQFGKPVGSFQALQHRLANCYVDVELNRSLLFGVLAAFDAGTSHPAMISAAKARIARSALNTVRTALQFHGALGYTEEHDIGIFYKRAAALGAKYGNELTHINRFSELTLSSN